MPYNESDSDEKQEEFIEEYQDAGEFIHLYAIVITTSEYSKLRKIYPKIQDLKGVVKDRINTEAQLTLMGFEPENIYYFTDSTHEELSAGHAKI